MRRHWMVWLGLLGCTSPGNGGEPAMKLAEGRVGVGAPTPARINALEPYERLVRNFAHCGLEGNQVVSTCAAVHAYETEMAGVSPKIRVQVGEAMLADASPAVRVQAASMLRVNGQLAPKSLDALAGVAATERNPRVLEAFIRIAGKQGGTNPSAAKLVLAAAGHADSGVRLDAIDAISAAENRGMIGGVEKLVALAETDADPRVRRAACAQAGKLGTDNLLPLYERATANVADPEFYAACMEGLVAMFHNHPTFDTASEGAYRLFLRRLSTTPRSEQSPPWTVMSTFCYFSREADLDKLVAWKQRVTWFDTDEVKRVLTSVITDRAASMPARSAAIESLVGLNVSPAAVATLRKELVDPTDKPLADKLAAICE